MRIFTLILMALVVTASGLPACATPGQAQVVVMAPAPCEPLGSPELLLINGIVQVRVEVESTLLIEEKVNGQTRIKEVNSSAAMGGTGFVVAKRQDKKGQWSSLIVTADHVLRAPKVGAIIADEIEFLGESVETGRRRIDSVRQTIVTDLGMTCNLKPMAEGLTEGGIHDVSTAEADCDAGHVLKIARSKPARGEKILVLGHPAGIVDAVMTEGRVVGAGVGTSKGLIVTSARVHGGNSGGPAIYNGEVFGLLIQVNSNYDQISYVLPVEEMLRRLSETPGW